MAERIPAMVFHPSEIVRDELAARGWTVQDLAKAMGRPEHLVTEIVEGRESITPLTAQWLAAAFQVSAECWTNMQALWDRHPDRRCPGCAARVDGGSDE